MPRRTTPEREPRHIDATSYNDVVGRTEVRGIRLLENRFEIKPDAIHVDPSAWRKGVEFTLMEVIAPEDTEELYGIMQFEAVCRSGRRRVLTASARYLISYTVRGGCSVADGTTFIERVGRVAAYPYFRSLVATLTANAGIQMPPLPVISLAPRSLGYAATLGEGSAKGR